MRTHPRELLARFEALHPRVIDLSLGRIERLLARLDHPERRLPPAVHIAGTNGKGSTLAFLRAAFEAAGHTVNAYTSPHLVRFNERIVLAGREIGDDALIAALETCESANDGADITFFEITTAVALLAFADTPADVLLLETGLGGRLDATNVVDTPRLCAITPIAHDHHQYLGETLPEIAGEKAGILKREVVAAVGPQPPEALRAVEARAAAVGAPLHRFGREWTLSVDGEAARYESDHLALEIPALPLPGRHQIDNAGLALAGLDLLTRPSPGAAYSIDGSAMRAGLSGARWPGRLQRLLAALALAGNLLNRPLSIVSTGERQRLALARALMDDPKVLLLDEPTAALDPQATALVEELIKYQLLSGRGVILASHNRAQIERLAHVRLLLPKRPRAGTTAEHAA